MIQYFIASVAIGFICAIMGYTIGHSEGFEEKKKIDEPAFQEMNRVINEKYEKKKYRVPKAQLKAFLDYCDSCHGPEMEIITFSVEIQDDMSELFSASFMKGNGNIKFILTPDKK